MRFVILAFRRGCKPMEYDLIGVAEQFFQPCLGAKDQILSEIARGRTYSEYHVVCVRQGIPIIRCVNVGFASWEWRDYRNKTFRDFRRPDGKKVATSFTL